MQIQKMAVAGVLAAGLSACSGGGGGGGSSNPPVQPTLSADQQTFESVNLQGGQFSLLWKLPPGGGNLVPGTHYLSAVSNGLLPQSPARGGAQIQTGHATTLDTALDTRTFAPTRYLSAGAVVVAPLDAIRRVSYVGDGVRVDYLASDGATVLTSAQFSQFAVVPLSGAVGGSPEELLASVPIEDWIAFNNFAANATWQAGSAYVRQHGVRVGDVVIAQDCPNDTTPTTTTGNQPTPCATGATLEQVFPATLPLQTLKPYEHDLLADGRIAQVAGVRMWVANAPLPLEQSITPAYRVYYELNGNVYAGLLEKDGAPFHYRQADGSVVDYAVSLNQAAVSSVQAGVITGAAPGSLAGSAAEVGATVDLFGIGGHGIDGALTPADLRAHYDIPAGLDGTGQTIAIVDAPALYDVAQADLNVFSQTYGLPQCNAANPCFRHVDLSNGVAAPDDGWSGEIALDTQMAHAIAPGATIVLVTAASRSEADLMAAVDYAAALPGVTAISMSFSGNTWASHAAEQDARFAALQANGIAVFASTGDDGFSNAARYPAASPYVTAVGGTTITAVAGAAGVGNESAWQYSGGGPNPSELMPGWQSAAIGSIAIAANGNVRTVPDVAAVADFQHSAFATYREQQWVMAGGTSAATPLWAGISALMAQNLAGKGSSLAALVRTTPGGFNGLLYQPRLGQGATPALVGIASGSNDLSGGFCSLCAAAGGYNDATGLGRPDVASLIAAF
ncbi:S53 family peptidase [Scleromatobacter humisilvae]|uniref:S53 family peptidase n=1 Tax=Scleromatobacter humisilvae TaxID=2897159 RepID=A0A9X1YPK9_9BURK|nr:S53 family peptidase [Scleromatobacter humisilvae]MCK9688297.1 S53 family peptidase [Scleromatobacter humisilvae]